MDIGNCVRMRAQELLSVFAVSALVAVIACSSQKVHRHYGITVASNFYERPFHFDCSPAPLQPGSSAFTTGSRQALYARSRSHVLDLPLRAAPSLTIAAELGNIVEIAASPQDRWIAHYCATGKGNSPQEADGNLKKIAMQQTGSLLTLNSPGAIGSGRLLLEVPAGAPLTVHSDDPLEIHDLSGPVRVSSLGRAVILKTTGRVDVWAMAVNFAGSQGSVFLNASRDINFMIAATRFQGSLGANAQHQVNAYFPAGFQTSVDVLVNRPKDFICRADFCSKFKKDREGGLYRFTYGDAQSGTDRIGIRSMAGQVLLATIP
ncbi:MAG: hypothetical protein ACLGPM_00425 [Acidobacteriota bacterium]